MLYQISLFVRPGEGIHAKAHQSDDETNHWVSIRSDSGNAVMHVADADAAHKLADLINDITRAPAQMQEAA
jgi:gas vesicle protein